MKLSIALVIGAALGLVQAENIRVGCRPDPDSNHAGTTMNEVIEFLRNADLRGKTVPELRYGFWDGEVQSCHNISGEWSDIFTFAYNYPFAYANYQFQAPPNGKWIQCFEAGSNWTCS